MRNAERHLTPRAAGAVAFALVLAAALASLVASCAAPIPLAPAALGQVAGKFEVQRAGSLAWVRDPAGADIRSGDRIRTLDDDATVQLPGPSTLQVGPNTILLVTGSSAGTLQLVQDAGSVEVSTKSPLTLRTPLITAGVRGTVFKVDVYSREHSRLATIEGAVQVDMGQERVLVTEGQEIDAKPGQTLATRPRTPEQPALLSVSAAGGQLQVSGAAEPSRDLELRLDSAAVAQLTSDASGRVSATLPAPAPGLHTLQAVALGSDTIRSEPSPLLVFSWTANDTPLYVRFPSLLKDTPGGTNSWTVRGYTEPGAQVKLENQVVPVDANGLFSATVPVAADANDIHAIITAGPRTIDMGVVLQP